MFMLEQAKKIVAIEKRLIEYVQPLNDRLKKIDMAVYWDSEDKDFYLNQSVSLGRGGVIFWMTDPKFIELIEMSDDELRDYCLSWGGKS